MIEIKDLKVKYGESVILDDISFDVKDGSWLMIIGPNGAGKSTITRAISRAIPYTGSITIDGKSAGEYKSRELARKIGILSQEHYVGYGFTVEEVIRLGLYSRRGPSEEYFEKAAALTGMEPYLKQSVLKLSGGELQRTFLAQLFAQDPETLILDEPTNHLDLIYQKQIMEMIENWRKEKKRTIISVVHDLSLARMFGTDAVIIEKGRLVKSGPASEVLISENLDPVYGMDVAAWIKKLQSVWEKE